METNITKTSNRLGYSFYKLELLNSKLEELDEAALNSDDVDALNILAEKREEVYNEFKKELSTNNALLPAVASELKELETFIDARKTRLKQLKEETDKWEKFCDKIKLKIGEDMVANNEKKRIAGDTVIIVSQSDIVNVFDMKLLPEEFKVYKPAPDPVPDKIAIKKAIKNGDIVIGATLDVNTNVKIK
jgi:hypothetical protein